MMVTVMIMTVIVILVIKGENCFYFPQEHAALDVVKVLIIILIIGDRDYFRCKLVFVITVAYLLLFKIQIPKNTNIHDKLKKKKNQIPKNLNIHDKCMKRNFILRFARNLNTTLKQLLQWQQKKDREKKTEGSVHMKLL